MTMRLDLRTRPGPLHPVLVRPDCYGCADCGQWFQFPGELIEHDCPAREARDRVIADLLDGDGDA